MLQSRYSAQPQPERRPRKNLHQHRQQQPPPAAPPPQQQRTRPWPGAGIDDDEIEEDDDYDPISTSVATPSVPVSRNTSGYNAGDRRRDSEDGIETSDDEGAPAGMRASRLDASNFGTSYEENSMYGRRSVRSSSPEFD